MEGKKEEKKKKYKQFVCCLKYLQYLMLVLYHIFSYIG